MVTLRGQGEAIKWLREHADFQHDYCLIWPFSRGEGYGQFGFEGKIYRANRFMCELAHGPAPSVAHQAAHSCGNGKHGCVNPKHLSWKTNGDNQLDRRKHGTKNQSGKTMTPGVHISKFTPEQDEEIRRLRAAGVTLMEIARKFGVTHSTIQYRLYGGSYKPRRERLGRVSRAADA